MLPRSHEHVWICSLTFSSLTLLQAGIVKVIESTKTQEHYRLVHRPLSVFIIIKITEMADIITGSPDLVSLVLIILVATLSFRLVQRIYYVLRGHIHHYSYHPRQEMVLFLKKNDIELTEHSFVSTRDKVCLRYRKLGTGPKIVLLNNGVGTDFYMWLPTIRGKNCPSSKAVGSTRRWNAMYYNKLNSIFQLL